MEGSLTEKNFKIEDDFFFGSLAVCGERNVGEGRGSEVPSKLSGVRTSSENRQDSGDPGKVDVGGEVGQVDSLAVD